MFHHNNPLSIEQCLLEHNILFHLYTHSLKVMHLDDNKTLLPIYLRQKIFHLLIN